MVIRVGSEMVTIDISQPPILDYGDYSMKWLVRERKFQTQVLDSRIMRLEYMVKFQTNFSDALYLSREIVKVLNKITYIQGEIESR